jgi:UDP-N-acetylglucosamine--N-acetylmuramyl-(pentapeptide) pyrophosphoryl-undecaprenol N-acetylglucosamine transferase
VWVTGASEQANALRASGEEVETLPPWGRDPPGARGLLPNLRAARRVAVRHRPDLVVTNGAGLVVPFVLMARLLGSDVIVIETMARITQWSLTGKLLRPFADTVVVQWPEMRRGRRTVVCRPALLEAAGSRPAPPGHGTFVSVGTRPEPFDRLLAMVDRAVGRGLLPMPVIVQSGSSSYRPAHYETTSSMTPRQVADALAGSRHVICHGGAGMVAMTVAGGKRPMVLARRRAAGEHRTEHQQQLVDKLASEGAIVALEEEIGEDELRQAERPPQLSKAPGPSLEETLERLVAESLGGLR